MVEFGLARRDDLDEIVRLLTDDPLGTQREASELTPYEKAFSQITADPNTHLIVGRDDNRVVSVVQLSILPTLAVRGTTRGQLEGVRVHASRRGEGIGRDMCRWAIGLARQKGCGVIQLTTDRRRPDAVAFYEGLGFENSHDGMKLWITDRDGHAGQ